MIPAHDSPLAALAFDASGTKLATASEKVNDYFECCFLFFTSICVLFNATQILFLPPLHALSSLVYLSPLRERLSVSFQSQRDRSSLSFEEE